VPSPDELHQFCNLGYAKCGRIPASRFSDAVRFGVAQDRGTEIVLKYALEKGHVPVTHGSLICDLLTGNWSPSHPDPRIQKMAQCFLQSYLQRRPFQTLAASTSS